MIEISKIFLLSYGIELVIIFLDNVLDFIFTYKLLTYLIKLSIKPFSIRYARYVDFRFLFKIDIEKYLKK